MDKYRNYKKRGSALLSALLLMTLMAIVATAMMLRIQYDMYRTRALIIHDDLILATDPAIFWALNRIVQLPLLNAADKQGIVAHLPQKSNNSFPAVTVKGDLYDLQARFNINNLQNREYWFFFVRLLQKFVPKLDLKMAYYILTGSINWISPYKVGGADQFTQYYAKQIPPYFPGYAFMKSISEFRLVAGVTQDMFNSLLPYITVLPTTTRLNVNTAPIDLFMCLAANQTPENKERFLNEREQKGIFKAKDIQELENKFQFPAAQITAESDYFLLIVTAKEEDINLQTYVIIRKMGKKSVIISKTYDTL